ncbi:MAG: NAD(P)-dependent oxidoreductase [Deltaproteobacteria bacterium]|nr:NAD(P)-dependent oxidoreductase [Deltaproteobacteria bacterium]
MKGAKVLVTGANGFLGAHLVQKLLKKGYQVLAAHRPDSSLQRLKPFLNEVEQVELELNENPSIKNVFNRNRPEIVIHCAAYGVNYSDQDIKKALSVNVSGTLELIKAASHFNISRFLHIGSCFEYGDKKFPVKESDLLEPTGIYGATKASATLLAMTLSRQLSVPLAIIRPFGLWGPMEEEHRLVPLVIKYCLSNQPLPLTGGKQIRDYLYVEDAASMIIALVEGSGFPSYEIVNLGTGIPVTLKAFILTIAGLFQKEHLMGFGRIPYRPTEMWYLVADTTKWQRLIGEYKRTTIAEGIEKVLIHNGIKDEKN